MQPSLKSQCSSSPLQLSTQSRKGDIARPSKLFTIVFFVEENDLEGEVVTYTFLISARMMKRTVTTGNWRFELPKPKGKVATLRGGSEEYERLEYLYSKNCGGLLVTHNPLRFCPPCGGCSPALFHFSTISPRSCYLPSWKFYLEIVRYCNTGTI